jgi:hypothetical protein
VTGAGDPTRAGAAALEAGAAALADQLSHGLISRATGRLVYEALGNEAVSQQQAALVTALFGRAMALVVPGDDGAVVSAVVGENWVRSLVAQGRVEEAHERLDEVVRQRPTDLSMLKLRKQLPPRGERALEEKRGEREQPVRGEAEV